MGSADEEMGVIEYLCDTSDVGGRVPVFVWRCKTVETSLFIVFEIEFDVSETSVAHTSQPSVSRMELLVTIVSLT
jgi:hypothetical protein